MGDRIKLDMPSGLKHPATVPFEGDALLVTEPVLAEGGDIVSFKLDVPKGAGPMRLAAVLVKVDD